MTIKRTFAYRKLIRDKILESMLEHGEHPVYHRLDDAEYMAELKRKILEEASELDLSSPDQILAELVDLQEIIDAMLKAIGRTRTELVRQQAQKRQRSGGFEGRIYLDTVQKTANDPWLAHLEAHPDKYPEL